MARFFIDRPIFAIVISVLIVLIGTIAGFSLPIGLYPQIEPPTVAVSTMYIGANSNAVNQSVAQVIEEQVNGVQGMDYMASYSGDSGSYNLNVIFELGIDGDIASVKVQNNVAQANASLPAEVKNFGIVTKKSSPNMAMVLGFYSKEETFHGFFIYNYISVYLLDAIKRINGVGDVQLYGSEFSRRIWINPDRLADLGLTISQVIAAIQEQNVQAPAGTVGAMPVPGDQEFQYTGKVKGRLESIEEFENIIITAQPNGSFLLLKDIARIENGGRNQNFIDKFNGSECVGMAINLTGDANAMTTVAAIKEVIGEAKKNFPPDLDYGVIMDTTDNINASIKEVTETFFIALLLVFIIVFIFLQSPRATLIPMIAVPVSLIGTFGSFVILGFSINTLTLFAMVLAIGLVVDDAIVVIEAVEHHIQVNKLSPRDATIRAMEEVSAPVIAIAFVLASVFIPVAFIGGMTGVLYRQFALTIAVSMGLSAFVALSLTPALCAALLKPHRSENNKGFFGYIFTSFNRGFDLLTGAYIRSVMVMTNASAAALFIMGVVIAGLVYLWGAVPSTFVPSEDQSFYIASVSLPGGTSLNRTKSVMDKFTADMQKQPGVKNLMVVSGFDVLSTSAKSNAGTMFVGLDNWSERLTPETRIDSEIGAAFRAAAGYPEASVMAFNVPPLPGLGMLGGFTMVLQDLTGHSEEELSAVVGQFVRDANGLPETSAVYTTYENNYPGYDFEVDREKVKSLGVPLNEVFAALQVNFGGAEVNDFSLFGRTYKVVLQAESAYRNEADAMRFIYVRSSNGSLVPLDTLVTPTLTSAPPVISRFNGARSIQVNGSIAPGYSSGQALSAMEDLAQRTLPSGFAVEWSGQSREEKRAGNSSSRVIGLALVFVFLCLSALYESWSVPFAVLLSVPTGIFGAFLSQYIMGLENSIYMQIGIITLIGLAAKNAILIVEYAKVRTDNGMSAGEAAVEAAGLRLRPILMTSLAFIIGCVPLAMASGAGAAARNAMGTSVVGGMTVATLLGVFVIPSLFVVVERAAGRFAKAKKTTICEPTLK